MRIIALSDHPAEQLREVRQRRQGAAAQAQARYEQERARHGASVAAASAVRDEARAQRRWLAWLRGIFTVWGLRQRPPVRPAFDPGSTDREEILAAGVQGEQLVANELGRVLGDDWVLVRGYRNSRGEIDHLLLGPRGLFAIEVKHRNAKVHIDGDEWRFEKYDRYGNLVQQGLITDRGGRSPSRQVNDSADALARFLHSRGQQQVVIQRIVVLTHPRSELGHCRGLTVHVATSMDVVVGWIRDSAAVLPPAEVTALLRLIERDHRYHQPQHGPGRDGARPGTRS